MKLILNNRFVKRLLSLLIAVTITISLSHYFLGTPIPFLTRYNANMYISKYLGRKNLNIRYDVLANYYYYERQNGDRVVYNFNRNTIREGNLDYEANQKYYGIDKDLKLDLDLPKRIYMIGECHANDFNLKKQKLYIVDILDKSTFDETRVKKRIADVIMRVINYLGEDYNITDLQVGYGNLSGYYKVNIDSHSSFKPINKDIIIKHVAKVNEDEWAEDYRNWKRENEKD